MGGLFGGTGLLVLLVIGLLIALYLFSRTDSFWLTDFTHRFPIVGKLARYSKDYSETQDGGWLNVEATLCRDYARHCTSLSKEQFENDREYLRKSYDHGRKPIPSHVFAGLGLLVALEGLGFSYMLGSWMAIDSSENLRDVLTIAIVVVLATVLLWVTHAAGHQLYRTRLLRSCFRQFQASAITRQHEAVPKAARFTTDVISLSDDQSVDDDELSNVQCANRVATHPGDLGSYAWVWVAGIIVVFIAVLSFVLRMESLHGMALDADTPDAAAAQEYAAFASFAILSAIFVVTQIVGVGVGYWYGFAGKESKEAYKETGGCADFQAYFRPVRQRINLATVRLASLHRMMERNLPQEIQWKRDFVDFIKEERERGATDLQDPTQIDTAPRKRGKNRSSSVKPVASETLQVVPNDSSPTSGAERRPHA